MQCPNGHVYDEKKFSSCPYCQGGASGIPLNGVGAGGVLPQGIPVAQGAFPRTMGAGGAPAFPKTEPADSNRGAVNKNATMSHTVALDETGYEAGMPQPVVPSRMRPVVGWLVVVEGDRKGLSFVVHGEMNYIGRDSKYDINLFFDPSVSGEGDCAISYDDRERVFSVATFHNKNIVRHNGKVLLAPVELKDYDLLEIGTTKLRFRSFCNEQFKY